MPTNSVLDLKQLVMTAWRERWSEREWSMHTKQYLNHPSDVFHIADILVSQAYIGKVPNSTLVNYIKYAISTGMLSYAAVFAAVAKHEDLHKLESTREVYALSENYLSIINEIPLVEDPMTLCSTLRVILQWLFHNTELYLKGVSGIYPTAADEFIKLNCQIIEQLTTRSRTSMLLTIARFEESSAWSNIETDLAVVKTASAQNILHKEISDACHHVSQLSRCPILSRSVYPVTLSSLQVFLPLSGFIIFEVERRTLTEPEGFALQLSLLSQIHGLSTFELLFYVIQTCLMGFLDSVHCKTEMEHEWSAMIYLRIPKIFCCLRSNLKGSEFESPSRNAIKKSAHFESELIKALHKLCQLDCLLDALDQLKDGVSWLKSLTEHFVSERLITAKPNIEHLLQIRKETASYGQEKCQNPQLIVKSVSTLKQLMTSINAGDFATQPEMLLKTFQGICSQGSFHTLIACAAASGQLSNFASKLMQFNEGVKASSAENSKTAQIRAVLFDMSSLLTCHMVNAFRKPVVMDPIQKTSEMSGCFLYQWIKAWWVLPTNRAIVTKYETDTSRVEVYIKILRTSNEFRLSLTKWQDVCINLPQAFIELIIAKQKGYLSFADLTKACNLIRDNCPLCVILAVMLAIVRALRLCVGHSDHIKMLEILAEKSQAQHQSSLSYDERYAYFGKILVQLMGDLLPEFDNSLKPNLGKSAGEILQVTLQETKNHGWINNERLKKFLFCLKFLDIKIFTRHLIAFILKEIRLDAVEAAINIVFTVMKLNLESFTIHMLQSGIPDQLLSDPHSILNPVGSAIAKMTVACLDIVLNDCLLKQKMLLASGEKLSPFLYEASPNKGQDNLHKVRRLLSSSTEHDLASSGSSSGLPPTEPILIVLADFIQKLWKLMTLREPSPLNEFIFTFIKCALFSTPLVSRSVKQLLPVELVKELSSRLVENGRELLFAASDLGNPEVRRIAAEAICLADTLQ
ncbi:mediator of RNA polymerase II transcription subunit 24-like [Clavelina lepadiformis]|uniref:mediator of RNA polymerase II transcription subunit 24-like n=1 Tax=Clavelina lepadiformis TaxID=159417 RepID=UPI004043540D